MQALRSIDALAARIKVFAPADLQRWSYATPAGSSYSSMALPGPGFSGLMSYVQDMKNFMFVGGYCSWWLDRSSVAAGGWITRLDTVASRARGLGLKRLAPLALQERIAGD